MFKLLRNCASARFSIQTISHLNLRNCTMKSVIVSTPVSPKYQMPVIYCVKNYSNKASTFKSNRTSVPEKIHAGGFSTILRTTKLLSTITSIVGICRYERIYEFLSNVGGETTTICLCGLAGAAVFGIPSVLHFATRKYVYEIVHDPVSDEYTAMTMNYLMLKIFVSPRIASV